MDKLEESACTGEYSSAIGAMSMRRSSHTTPKPMPQLAQGRELGEAEKPEGIAMLRLAFQRADHERASEALSEAHALSAIKIAAA
jgi:hypothetical protein